MSPACQAPSECKVSFSRNSRILSDSRESCAWSVGALRRLFWGGAKVSSESSPSSGEAEPLCSTLGHRGIGDGWTIVPLNCLLPGLVRCLRCFLQVQLGCGFLRAIKRFSVDGGGCINDGVQTLDQRLFREKSGCGCVLNHAQNWRFGCNECSKVCGRPATFRALLYPIPDWLALR